MAAILRVRDENGHVVGIPAIVGPRGPAGHGTGDMLESVYDPRGLREDIYEYADGKLSKFGGTMKGPITLSGDPTDDNHAANKKYVDAVKQTAGNAANLALEQALWAVSEASSKQPKLTGTEGQFAVIGGNGSLTVADVTVPKIHVGKYIGSGVAGVDKPTSRTFPFKPIALVVYDNMLSRLNDESCHNATTVLYSGVPKIHVRGKFTKPDGTEEVAFGYLNVTFSDNTVSWYVGHTFYPNEYIPDPYLQLNGKSETYTVIAIGE